MLLGFTIFSLGVSLLTLCWVWVLSDQVDGLEKQMKRVEPDLTLKDVRALQEKYAYERQYEGMHPTGITPLPEKDNGYERAMDGQEKSADKNVREHMEKIARAVQEGHYVPSAADFLKSERRCDEPSCFEGTHPPVGTTPSPEKEDEEHD